MLSLLFEFLDMTVELVDIRWEPKSEFTRGRSGFSLSDRTKMNQLKQFAFQRLYHCVITPVQQKELLSPIRLIFNSGNFSHFDCGFQRQLRVFPRVWIAAFAKLFTKIFQGLFCCSKL